MENTMAMNPEAVGGAVAGVLMLVWMVVCAVTGLIGIIANWKIFSKAGQPGWAIFIPIYNAMCFCRVIGKSDFWWLLCLIPVYGQIVVPIIATVRLARAFGKGVGFAICLLLIPGVNLILYLMLAFGAEYVGFPEETSRAAAPAA